MLLLKVGSTQAQRMSAGALANIAAEQEAQQAAIHAAGGTDALYEKALRGDAHVQKVALGALKNLAPYLEKLRAASKANPPDSPRAAKQVGAAAPAPHAPAPSARPALSLSPRPANFAPVHRLRAVSPLQLSTLEEIDVIISSRSPSQASTADSISSALGLVASSAKSARASATPLAPQPETPRGEGSEVVAGGAKRPQEQELETVKAGCKCAIL